MDMDAFGKRLRERREQAGFSQTEVAKQTGIIQRDLSLLERGKKHALWLVRCSGWPRHWNAR
jgi:transcriptional regulator with XRE-family HTH domain